MARTFHIETGNSGLTDQHRRAADLLRCVPLELRASAMRYSQQQEATAENPTNDQFEAQEREEDLIRAAKGFIWAKEFARVQHVLRGAKSHKARFLALYSRYLVGSTLFYIPNQLNTLSQTSEKKAVDEYERAISV